MDKKKQQWPFGKTQSCRQACVKCPWKPTNLPLLAFWKMFLIPTWGFCKIKARAAVRLEYIRLWTDILKAHFKLKRNKVTSFTVWVSEIFLIRKSDLTAHTYSSPLVYIGNCDFLLIRESIIEDKISRINLHTSSFSILESVVNVCLVRPAGQVEELVLVCNSGLVLQLPQQNVYEMRVLGDNGHLFKHVLVPQAGLLQPMHTQNRHFPSINKGHITEATYCCKYLALLHI